MTESGSFPERETLDIRATPKLFALVVYNTEGFSAVIEETTDCDVLFALDKEEVLLFCIVRLDKRPRADGDSLLARLIRVATFPVLLT